MTHRCPICDRSFPKAIDTPPRFADLRNGGNLPKDDALGYGWIATFAIIALMILLIFAYA